MPEKEPQSCATPFRTMIGGQALIEGIMMLGPEKKSIVVRRPDGGLEIKTEERKLIKDRHPILGWPFIRGVVNFCTSMYTGVTALMYSAEFYPEDEAGEEEPSRFEQWLDKKLGSEKAMSLFTTLAVWPFLSASFLCCRRCSPERSCIFSRLSPCGPETWWRGPRGWSFFWGT